MVDSEPTPGASLPLPLAAAPANADAAAAPANADAADAAAADAAAADAAAADDANHTETPRRGNEKILVVEDQPEIRSLISRILKREGYGVEEATSGKHALELAAVPNVHFDLVLTDVSMPEMTGLEFGRRLASLHPTLPVLYMSGYTEPTLSTMQISDGGTGAGTGTGTGTGTRQIFLFLEKPFTIVQLVSKVREVLALAKP